MMDNQPQMTLRAQSGDVFLCVFCSLNRYKYHAKQIMYYD